MNQIIRQFQLGELSLSEASNNVGLKKDEFLEILQKLGIPIINYKPTELENEYNQILQYFENKD